MKDFAAGLPQAPKKREEITRFIIGALGPYVNERKTGIKGIKLYLLSGNSEEDNLINVALYADMPGLFKTRELERKLSDHYIVPDQGWYFEFRLIRDKLPHCTISRGNMGLDIIKDTSAKGSFTKAAITVLSGQAEKDEYILDPAVKLKYTIGRGKKPVLTSGRMHANDIVFIAKEEPGFDEQRGGGNLTVSRYHAAIIFKPDQNKYYIAAEARLKLFSDDGKLLRLEIPGTLHELTDGDQVELGGSARLLFRKQ